MNADPAVNADDGVHVQQNNELQLLGPGIQRPPATPWLRTIPLPASEAGAGPNMDPAVNADGEVGVRLSTQPQLLGCAVQHPPATPWLRTIPLPASEAGPGPNAEPAVSVERGVHVRPSSQPQLLGHAVVHPPATPWLRNIPLPTSEVDAGFNAQAAVGVDGRLPVEPSIDPLLTAPAHRAHPTALQWDLAEHPNYIKLGTVGSYPARDLLAEDLARCAVGAVENGVHGTPIMLMRITLVFPGLPLTVDCKPTNARALWASPLRLTVGDVLYGMYKALRGPVPPQEFNRLTQPHQQAVSRAFRTRLANDVESYNSNLRRGVRYIDYLGKMRMFGGLRPAMGMEIPAGKRRGEVFVVVLAPC